jgi:hypothetical protein
MASCPETRHFEILDNSPHLNKKIFTHNFEIFMSQRSKKMIVKDNYIYHFLIRNNECEKWRCSTRSCKAYLQVVGNKSILFNKHEHENHMIKINRFKLSNSLKQKATSTRYKSESIITATTSTLAIENLANNLKTDSMKKIISRERNKSQGVSVIKFVEIPISLRKDYQGNEFFIFDSGYEDVNRFVVFSSVFKRKIIDISEVWLIDATFRTCPVNFYQLLTIQTYNFNRSFPMFYILMNNKKIISYINIFNFLKTKYNVAPKIVVTDLEIALNNAIETVYSTVKKYYCMFHYSQALYKKMLSLGLGLLYKNNTEIKSLFKIFFHYPYFQNTESTLHIK